VIIFDFDKTLVNKDTLFGFYKAVDGKNKTFQLKRLLMLIAAFAYKLNLINNDKLKKIGIALFLNGKTMTEITSAAESYVKSLQLNQIYHEEFLNCPKHKRIIISASPEIYLKKMFPDEVVLGTVLGFKTKEVSLIFNCYRHKKLLRFQQEYPNSQIEKVYSDSYSDLPLFEESKEYNIIKDGVILNSKKSI